MAKTKAGKSVEGTSLEPLTEELLASVNKY